LEEAVRAAMRKTLLGSIGPITSDALRDHGIEAGLEPAHPRMGQLVHDVAQAAAGLPAKRPDKSAGN
jgi:uroporphyrinogen-III synthase